MNNLSPFVKKHLLSIIRGLVVIFCLTILLYVFMAVVLESDLPIDSDAKNYILENGYKDTGSKNLVTAIYLDYRLFDSIFEACILLVTVAGLVYMSKDDKEKL